MMTKKETDLVNSARNWMIGVACLTSLPVVMVAFLAIAQVGAPIIWDGVTIGLLCYSGFNSIIAILSAVLLNQRKAAGQLIGHLPAVLICLFFPLGTITGVFALIALNKKGITKQLA